MSKKVIKKIVFLWDSTIKPHSVDVKRTTDYLARLNEKGLTCESLDTKDMAEADLQNWRKEAFTISVSQHQQIRQHVGVLQLDLGKKAPALLVYEEGKKVPIAVYPHTEKRGRKKTNYSIEAFLEELANGLKG